MNVVYFDQSLGAALQTLIEKCCFTFFARKAVVYFDQRTGAPHASSQYDIEETGDMYDCEHS